MNYFFLLTTIALAISTYYYFYQLRQSQASQRQYKERASTLEYEQKQLRQDYSHYKERASTLEYEQKQLRQDYSKYDEIISREDFLQKLDLDIIQRQAHISQLVEQQNHVKSQILELKQEFKTLEEQEYFQSIAFYKPDYDFNDSIEIQNRLEQIHNQQKELINEGKATHILSSVTATGSKKLLEENIIQSLTKLVIRAFNVECDAAIAKAKFSKSNNRNTIVKAFEASTKDFIISSRKALENIYCYITLPYVNLKLEEIHLSYRYQEKKQQELDEQRLIRSQMREEQLALKEHEKARLDSEKEERRYQQALEKARLEISQSTGKQREKLEAQIQQLMQDLEKAQATKERAISLAQMTKSGHVYIISNIGSFGENVYKIGMTRRLDPIDRVIELGDASVPFRFDVHAMIFSQDAPELEKRLHKHFHHRRLNKVNERKEFFKVTLEEISEAVKQIAEETQTVRGEIHITQFAEASDYRKTIAKEEEI